ncbi:MAG: hypothetical protein IT318_24405 [Anaerolineales bacterium]|nr:hypothetical protein [Anaerolineales bacterium]
MWQMRRPQWLLGAAGALLGAGAGLLLGLALGQAAFGSLVGALGAGASALLGETVAGPIPDRRGAERFGLAMGGLGGLLALPVGLLVVLVVTGWIGGWEGFRTLWALLRADPNLGVLGLAAGALAGTVAGALSGYYLGGAGYRLGRRGAIAGAALAWTLAAILAGFITGDYASKTLGVARVDAALLGGFVQVAGGTLLLAALRRAVGRWRNLWVRRP